MKQIKRNLLRSQLRKHWYWLRTNEDYTVIANFVETWLEKDEPHIKALGKLLKSKVVGFDKEWKKIKPVKTKVI